MVVMLSLLSNINFLCLSVCLSACLSLSLCVSPSLSVSALPVVDNPCRHANNKTRVTFRDGDIGCTQRGTFQSKKFRWRGRKHLCPPKFQKYLIKYKLYSFPRCSYTGSGI